MDKYINLPLNRYLGLPAKFLNLGDWAFQTVGAPHLLYGATPGRFHNCSLPTPFNFGVPYTVYLQMRIPNLALKKMAVCG